MFGLDCRGILYGPERGFHIFLLLVSDLVHAGGLRGQRINASRLARLVVGKEGSPRPEFLIVVVLLELHYLFSVFLHLFEGFLFSPLALFFLAEAVVLCYFLLLPD